MITVSSSLITSWISVESLTLSLNASIVTNLISSKLVNSSKSITLSPSESIVYNSPSLIMLYKEVVSFVQSSFVQLSKSVFSNCSSKAIFIVLCKISLCPTSLETSSSIVKGIESLNKLPNSLNGVFSSSSIFPLASKTSYNTVNSSVYLFASQSVVSITSLSFTLKSVIFVSIIDLKILLSPI